MVLLPGTLDLLILRAIRWEPTHGAGVGNYIRLVTNGAFDVEEGTLYPALHRLEKDGLLYSEWGTSDAGRRARFYNLTPEGKRKLERLIADWQAYVDAVGRVVGHGRAHGVR